MTRTAYDLSEPKGLESYAAKQAWQMMAINAPSDVYGSVMDLWLPVASELWHRGELIPDRWNYRPGATSDPREPDHWAFELLEECPRGDLIAMGERLADLYQELSDNGDTY